MMSFDHFDEICKLLPLMIDVSSLKMFVHVNNWCDFFSQFHARQNAVKKTIPDEDANIFHGSITNGERWDIER